jgi:hypothetical protein
MNANLKAVIDRKRAERVAAAEAALMEADAICHEYTVAMGALNTIDPNAGIAKQVAELQAAALAAKLAARDALKAARS